MRDTWKRIGRRTTAVLAALAVVAGGMTIGWVAASTPTGDAAHAADASLFDPGLIITDHNFTDTSTMDAASVQAFLVNKEAGCRAANGNPCLKDYAQATTTRTDANGRCATYAGAASENAATIIQKVALACGISQKVLLVLLEKEQGLVTSVSPTSSMYRSATGYACPDTAPCDAQYYGFFNQVYSAALQFKRYAATPTSWAYQAGRTNNILLNPNAACGTKAVYIQNQATASLYIYTPYTPNQAALNNLYGTGDSCSSYGNRNFWRTYTDWFGSPTSGSNPIGYVDRATGGFGQVTVSGWAADPDVTTPIRVDFYIDNVGAASTTANISRADLGGVLGKDNIAHGYSTTITGVAGGTHSICSYAINVGPGGNTLLGCNSFTVPAGSPTAFPDEVSAVAGQLHVRGWAIDPDTAAPITVDVQVDGKVVASTVANIDNPSLAAAFPGYGTAHSYDTTVALAAGTHQVCLIARNVGAGSDQTYGCRSVTLRTGTPDAYMDSATAPYAGTVQLRGWTIDPDTTAPLSVVVTVDGKANQTATANVANASLATAFPGYGANHGFAIDVTGLAPGTHHVCILIQNVGAGSDVTGCYDLTAPTGSPQAYMDSATSPAPGIVQLRGWTFDPDTLGPLSIAVSVDGVANKTATANVTNPSLATAFPGYGADHGFAIDLSGLTPGRHNVCIVIANVGPGKDVTGCYDLSSPTGSPSMYIDSASATDLGTLTLQGWALDPDTTAPVTVRTTIDGVLRNTLQAGDAKASLATAFPGYGANHEFTESITGIGPGTHQVCFTAVNVGVGSDQTYCVPVAMVTGKPGLFIDDLHSSSAGVVSVAGWAIDPDTTDPVEVTIAVNGGPSTTVLANTVKASLGQVYPAYGSAHEFVTTLPGVAGGAQTVCVTAHNTGPGGDTQSCQVITVK